MGLAHIACSDQPDPDFRHGFAPPIAMKKPVQTCTGFNITNEMAACDYSASSAGAAFNMP